MTAARDLIHNKYCPDAADDECLWLGGLLNRVEDDRAHREAEKLRETADKLRPNAPDRTGLLVAALRIDPYEMRDGQLVRKSDGRPITI